jgi:hypothetical protein
MRAATSISTGAIGTCTCRRRADELWLDAGDQGSRIHLAFQAADQAQVDAVYAAGLAADGVDNGKPGMRPYHPGYYAAFLTDPDGNNIEAVFHGPVQRSSKAVTLTFELPT